MITVAWLTAVSVAVASSTMNSTMSAFFARGVCVIAFLKSMGMSMTSPQQQ